MDKRILGLLLIAVGLVFLFCALHGLNPVRVTKEFLTTGKYDKTKAEYDIPELGVTGSFVEVKPNSNPTTPGGTPQVVPA